MAGPLDIDRARRTGMLMADMSGQATISSGARSARQGSARLLVVLPALNEEKTVGQVVRDIPRDILGVGAVDVLVIDDGSNDRTAELARLAGADVISHPRRLGTGAAFQTALVESMARSADLLVSIDADGQFDPADIPRLIEPVLGGRADFATASRFIDPALTPKMSRMKLWGNRMMSRLVSRLADQRFFDVSCGMRCYNRRAALNLNLMGRFTYTQEVVLNLAFKGLRIVEVPIPVLAARPHGTSRVSSNLFRYAVHTSRIIFRCYRDYRPMRLMGRLALSLMLPAVALELFLLGHYLRTGDFSPHKWAGFTGAGLFLVGLLVLQTGMIGDMLNRHRIYLEELLYRQRLGDLGSECKLPDSQRQTGSRE